MRYVEREVSQCQSLIPSYAGLERLAAATNACVCACLAENRMYILFRILLPQRTVCTKPMSRALFVGEIWGSIKFGIQS